MNLDRSLTLSAILTKGCWAVHGHQKRPRYGERRRKQVYSLGHRLQRRVAEGFPEQKRRGMSGTCNELSKAEAHELTGAATTPWKKGDRPVYPLVE